MTGSRITTEEVAVALEEAIQERRGGAPKRYAAQAKRFYQEHQKEKNASARRYHQEHKEEIHARKKRYDQTHRSQINARRRQVRAEKKTRELAPC